MLNFSVNFFQQMIQLHNNLSNENENKDSQNAPVSIAELLLTYTVGATINYTKPHKVHLPCHLLIQSPLGI